MGEEAVVLDLARHAWDYGYGSGQEEVHKYCYVARWVHSHRRQLLTSCTKA